MHVRVGQLVLTAYVVTRISIHFHPWLKQPMPLGAAWLFVQKSAFHPRRRCFVVICCSCFALFAWLKNFPKAVPHLVWAYCRPKRLARDET